MHPLLDQPGVEACRPAIDALQKCHEENPGKSPLNWGRCTEFAVALDKCLRANSERKHHESWERSRDRQKKQRKALRKLKKKESE